MASAILACSRETPSSCSRRCLFGLTVEGLDERLVGQVSSTTLVSEPLAARSCPVAWLETAGKSPGGEPEQRCLDAGDQRQLPLKEDRGGGEEHDADCRGSRLHKTGRHQLLDHLKVIGEADHQIAKPLFPKKSGESRCAWANAESLSRSRKRSLASDPDNRR